MDKLRRVAIESYTEYSVVVAGGISASGGSVEGIRMKTLKNFRGISWQK